MVNGNKTTANNDQLLISVKTPYIGVSKVNSYSATVIGETESLYYRKEFRWSTDGILYNDWRELTNDNLRVLLPDPTKPFYPQYKFTQVGDGELEFESIALEVVSKNGIINNVPLCGISDNGACCGQQNLVFDCCGNTFNPYALGNSAFIYSQLSQVVSNMFGFCVQYYKTSADQRSKDVVLHEYSLLNVIAEGNVKIVIPDNQLPTREINFNPLMMDYPTIFEVHIVKNGFRQVFGQDSKPEVGDYLYFEQYMNKMYEINAVSETDDYLYSGAYWRVSLVQYQKKASVKFEDKQIEEEIDTLIFNMDKFNIEAENEEKDARKPDQYKTIGTNENDYVRRILDKKLFIGTEPIYNNWTMISKSYYALKSIERGNIAIQYRYDKGWSDEERMLTFWIRPKYTNAYGMPKDSSTDGRYAIEVKDIAEYNGHMCLKVDNTSLFVKNTYLNLTGTDYPKFVKIVDIIDDNLVTNQPYINDCMKNARVVKVTSNNFLYSEGGFEIIQTPNSLIVSIGGNENIFSFGNELTMNADEWYGIVLAIKPADKKMALWIYPLGKGDRNMRNMNTEIELKYYKMIGCRTDMSVDGGYWGLKGCDLDITNIRIWNEICEESLHNMILSQYVVKDSHLCELVDNAQPELLLGTVTNPR